MITYHVNLSTNASQIILSSVSYKSINTCKPIIVSLKLIVI